MGAGRWEVNKNNICSQKSGRRQTSFENTDANKQYPPIEKSALNSVYKATTSRRKDVMCTKDVMCCLIHQSMVSLGGAPVIP